MYGQFVLHTSESLMSDWIIALQSEQNTQEVTVAAPSAVQAVNRATPEQFRFSSHANIIHITVKRFDSTSNAFEKVVDTSSRAESVIDALDEARNAAGRVR
jgi:hypothetical protein